MGVIKFLKRKALYNTALEYTMKHYGFERHQAEEFYQQYDDATAISGFFDYNKTIEGSLYWQMISAEFKNRKNKSLNSIIKRAWKQLKLKLKSKNSQKSYQAV